MKSSPLDKIEIIRESFLVEGKAMASISFRISLFLLLMYSIYMVTLIPKISASPSTPTPAINIVIDPGHGGIDSGATYAEVEEKQVNLAVAEKLAVALEEQGYHVILTRERDEALSDSSPRTEIRSRHQRDLIQRGAIVNHFTPQIILSIHANSGSLTKRGGQVLYQAKGQGYLLAHILQQKLNHLANKNEVPLKNKSLYLLNRSKSIALIVEVGYISNPFERELLLNHAYQLELVNVMVEGINEFMFCFPWSITTR